MPEEKNANRTRNDKSTQAGEYVREEMEHIREGKHGARSTKQAIAIGLSKARRSGIKLPPPPGKKAPRVSAAGKRNPRRSRAILGALRREGRAAASDEALSRQARRSAEQRGSANRRKAARKAVQTKASVGRHSVALKAAATRARRASRLCHIHGAH